MCPVVRIIYLLHKRCRTAHIPLLTGLFCLVLDKLSSTNDLLSSINAFHKCGALHTHALLTGVPV
jgi:hypothetical protein